MNKDSSDEEIMQKVKYKEKITLVKLESLLYNDLGINDGDNLIVTSFYVNKELKWVNLNI